MAFDKNDTFTKAAGVVTQELHIEGTTITPKSTFQELGADSLDMVQIIMKLEEQFGLEINDDDAAEMEEFQQVVDYIHERRTK